MPESPEDDPGPKKKAVARRKKKAIDNAPAEPTRHIAEDEAETESASTQRRAVGETEPESAVTPVTAEGGEAGPAPSGGERAVESAPASSREIRTLEKRNKELLVRIRELEFQQVTDYAQDVTSATSPEEVSKGTSNIVGIVEDLAAQLSSALSMKQALEADLADTQTTLVEVRAAGDELRARAQMLEAKASLVQQLEDELTFVEEERAVTARLLKESEVQLDEIVPDRDALAEKLASEEARNADIAQGRMDLESQALNLGEALDRVRRELAQAKDSGEELMQQVKDLTGRLDTSETSRKALELESAMSRDVASQLQKELEEQREELGAVQTRFEVLSEQLEEQQLDNRDLIEANSIRKREVEALSAKNETITVELDLARRRLVEFDSAARHIKYLSQRIYKRFYGDPEAEKD